MSIPARPYVVLVYEGHSPRRAEAFATKQDAEDYEITALQNPKTSRTRITFVMDERGETAVDLS